LGYWYPCPVSISRNTEADEAVWDATSRNVTLTAPAINGVREAAGMIRLVENDRKSDLVLSSSEGLPSQFTWKLDQALPGRHTLHSYGAFSSEQALILIHARTGHCCLNKHLFCVGTVEEAKCRCGIDNKTVRHVLCICALGVAQQRTPRLSLAIDGVTYHTY
jgi:hypothetical protein